MEKKKNQKEIKNLWRWMKAACFYIVMGGAILFLLQFHVYVVQGESMDPTLKNGEYLLVNKSVSPKKYDIVTLTVHRGKSNEESYVKRVVGIPGDYVISIDGRLVIMPEGSWDFSQKEVTLENLPNNATILDLSDSGRDYFSKINKIPKGKYFVLGDNHRNSKDSRTFGLISNSMIDGVVSYGLF
ncbi:signal peptidase I [Enterococcus termitis]|uniref:Signal peptidase I n=1 Tax=Enterococcus termitis TaxID=332950 RepID=A0A1E5H167_9ENTE|nr:signal peptidase I [Enterococcus termitis]OEG18633.1 signal peptidase I [Enterococcus termitis]